MVNGSYANTLRKNHNILKTASNKWINHRKWLILSKYCPQKYEYSELSFTT